MPVGLRCNVEACVSLDGVGTLICGWYFEPEDEAVGIRVSTAETGPVDIVDGVVRVSRADVLEALATKATARELFRNRNCGFFTFAKGAAFGMGTPLGMTLSTSDESSSLGLVLTPEVFAGTLDPDLAAYLRTNARAVVEVLRAQDVLDEPPVRKLLNELGPETLEIERSLTTDGGPRGVDLVVDACAHFPGEGLVAVGWLGAPPERVSSVTLICGAQHVDVRPYLAFSPAAAEAAKPEWRFVVAAPQRDLGVLSRRLTLQFRIEDAGTSAVALSAQTGYPPLRRAAESLSGPIALALCELVTEHWKERAVGSAESISRVLPSLSTSGYETTSPMCSDTHHRVASSIDYLYHVPKRGLFVVGWLVDFEHHVREIRARWNNGSSPDVSGSLLRLSRRDVVEAFPKWSGSWPTDKVGFAAFVDAPRFARDDARSLYFTLTGDSRLTWRVRACQPRAPEPDPVKLVREVLDLVPSRESEPFFSVLGPVVEGLWSARSRHPDGDRVYDFGTPVEQPVVSVIVPLFGRADFLEYQLSLFAGDADWADAELIYVVDDPRIADEVLRLCRERQQLFQVPFRVVVCERNNGFARANNIGVGHARGRLLLLLNSDVMPARHGWLSEMVRTYDALDRPGALGVKLLFPDGSIQHAGMSFEQVPRYPGLWLNDHPGKGHPNRPAREPRKVPSVTAACLMIDRALYLEVGGLDEDYILGDFEDSDLCLKLREKGRASFLAPAVELYHLERQSQKLIGDNHWRSGVTLYNAWRHTTRWDASIRELMEEMP